MVDGLIELVRLLSRPCPCERNAPTPDCRRAPLDKWWIRAVLGTDDLTEYHARRASR